MRLGCRESITGKDFRRYPAQTIESYHFSRWQDGQGPTAPPHHLPHGSCLIAISFSLPFSGLPVGALLHLIQRDKYFYP